MQSLPASGRADSKLKLDVSLASGRRETVSVLQHGTVCDLKTAAQQALGQSFLRLAASDGRLLDPAEALQLSGIQDGDTITAIAQQPKLAATAAAFALWCVGSDRIATWGDPNKGGDSTAVQDQLKDVRQICATHSAFAAIRAQSSLQDMLTWGKADSGGDSTAVQDQLRNVQQICATHGAFAAIFGRWIRGDMGLS